MAKKNSSKKIESQSKTITILSKEEAEKKMASWKKSK